MVGYLKRSIASIVSADEARAFKGEVGVMISVSVVWGNGP